MKQIKYNEQRQPLLMSLIFAMVIFAFNTTITALFNFPGIFIVTSLSGLLAAPYFLYQMRNIGTEPYKYFSEHPILVHEPKMLYNFQMLTMEEHGINVERIGCILPQGHGVPYGIDLPIEAHIDGLVYRYSQQPSGIKFRWDRDINLFWSADDAYYYVGKVGQVKPAEPLELRSFKTGFMGRHRWYYIQYNNGIEGGFTLQHMLDAAGISDAYGTIENEDEAKELVALIRDNGVLEKIKNSNYAMYFDKKENAEKVLEWLNSRHMMKMMFTNSI